jgi:uncharacterized protein YjbJ (UPF0337 family)
MNGKREKFNGRVENEVAVLTVDERLKDRRKLDQAESNAKDAIEQVIDKATRATKRISKK